MVHLGSKTRLLLCVALLVCTTMVLTGCRTQVGWHEITYKEAVASYDDPPVDTTKGYGYRDVFGNFHPIDPPRDTKGRSVPPRNRTNGPGTKCKGSGSCLGK